GVVAAHVGRVELDVVQPVALAGDRVPGQDVERGQGRHACADAQRDRQPYQRREHAVAAEAAQREFEVVAVHGGLLGAEVGRGGISRGRGGRRRGAWSRAGLRRWVGGGNRSACVFSG